MKKLYEVTTERPILVRVTHAVAADSAEEAIAAAMAGKGLASAGHVPQHGMEALLRARDLGVEHAGRAPLEDVSRRLDSDEAFSLFLRTLTPDGVSEWFEVQLYHVALQGSWRGLEVGDFPGGENRRRIREADIVELVVDGDAHDHVAVSGIEYDLDGDDEAARASLPASLRIEVAAGTGGEELEEAIGDEIARRTGFCVKGFTFERIDA